MGGRLGLIWVWGWAAAGLGAAAITAGAYYGSYYPDYYGYGYGGYSGYGYGDCSTVPQRIFDGYGYRVVWTNSCGY